jgi:hypothetical protein
MAHSSSVGPTRGIITIATGSSVYHDMARDLALSLKRHCGHLHRAILTNSNDTVLCGLYDTVVRERPEFGADFGQKLWLDRYSPFEETLFIDCDSLVLRDLTPLLTLFDGRAFGYVGDVCRSGYWYGDVAKVIQQLDLPWLPAFNSGLLFFRRGALATQVFQRARDVYGRYDDVGFDPLRGSRSDEPCFAVALAEADVLPVDDQGTAMRTPIGMEGRMDIDVLTGRIGFVKRGTRVAPGVVHFATWQFHPIYYRERAKLRLDHAGGIRRMLARPGAAAVYARESWLRWLHGAK